MIHNSDGYCGKLLHLFPNYQCSLHYHRTKHETFTCIEGTVWVEYYPLGPSNVETGQPMFMGEPTLTLLRGWAHDSLALPPYTPHRFWTVNPHAILAEFSTPHSDLDVVRIESSRKYEGF